MNCEIGIITTPVYQPLTTSMIEEFIFYANPDFELIVELTTGTTGLNFEPNAILTFSPSKTSADIQYSSDVTLHSLMSNLLTLLSNLLALI